MNGQRNKLVTILVILLFFAQTIFGSMPASVAAATTTPANVTVTMTVNGQPYDGSKMTSAPVLIEATASTAIEYSTDHGFAWQAYNGPITVIDTGVHHYLFREVGTIPIETANVHIMPVPAQQAITTSPDSIYYVNAAVQTSGDGTSWESAYKDLQEALDAAENRVSSADSVHIYVAQGTYKPSVRAGETDSRNAYFQLQNNVAIYGGFSGNGDERNIQKYTTILSGDIGNPDDNTDNAYHVFYHPQGLNLNATAILDGVTITGGNATIARNDNGGGGMFNIGSSPTITNVTFFKNESITTGGAIFNSQSSNPILTNVIFSENAANGHGGGGMYNGSNSNPVLTNIVFNGNLAIGQYGDGNGGAINNYKSSNPKLTNVTFNENKAVYGAGMWNLESNPVLTNVTISGNITNGSNTGAIHNFDIKSSPKIRNSIIVGNTGTAISGGQATVEHSLLGDYQIGRLYDGEGIPSVDKYKIEDIFIHPDLANPTSANYRLKAGSPAIDKGVSTYPEIAQVMKDLDGNDRIRGASIDLGAYEALPYDVTYEANGATGSVPMDPFTYAAGDTVTVKAMDSSLEKIGYTFGGWNTQADGNGTNYAAGSTYIMGATNVTFYAQWTKIPTFTVTYEGNGSTGGTVPTDLNDYETNRTATILGNVTSLVKTGWTFAGWNTEADGSGTDYAAGSTYTMGTADVTLYAQWTKNPTFTVTYEENGATGGQVPTDANEYEENQTATVLGNVNNLVKTGHTFTGWNTEADGNGTDYAVGSTYTMSTADVTLYAQWKIDDYTVSFDAQGVTAIASQTIQYNEKVVIPTPPTKAGYTFTGWYWNNVAWDFNTPIIADVTLTAKWQAVSTGGGGGNSAPSPLPIVPTPIVQQVFENGELHYRATLTRENVQTIIATNVGSSARAAHVVFPSEPWVEATLTATSDILNDLVNQQTDLFVETAPATILVPHTSLNGWTEELFFRIAPVKSDKRETLEENARQNEQVQTFVGNQMTVNLFGEPVTIETNIQNRPVMITLPIPSDVTEEQLASLFVYIEHSDGTTEVKRGQIVEMPSGVQGFEFEVTHFSTFALLYTTEKEEVTEETEETILAPYIKGYPDGTFKPNAAVTRAQMATMLARFLTNGDIPQATSTFADTRNSDAKDAIEFVKQTGLFNGTTATTFNPNGTITRAQMAAVVARWIERACAEDQAHVYCQETGKGKAFTDVATSHWAASSIEKVSALGIMSGNSATTFNPNGTLTRAQAVKVLNQLFERPVLEDITTSTFKDVPATHWAIGDIEAAATEMMMKK